MEDKTLQMKFKDKVRAEDVTDEGTTTQWVGDSDVWGDRGYLHSIGAILPTRIAVTCPWMGLRVMMRTMGRVAGR